MLRLAAIAAALLLSVPVWAQELKGVALVIGESKYETLTQLVNPNQDARDIDDLLDDLGFEVNRVLNADAEELREAIEEFIEDAEDADVALVYYSGHGIEVGGAELSSCRSTRPSTRRKRLAVRSCRSPPMLDELAKAVPVTIVLLDACRSDPFPIGTVIKLPGSDAAVTVTAEPGLAAGARADAGRASRSAARSRSAPSSALPPSPASRRSTVPPARTRPMPRHCSSI